jgi:hypothetical protein
MQHGRATPFNALDLIGQMRKIRRQNGGNNLSHFGFFD